MYSAAVSAHFINDDISCINHTEQLHGTKFQVIISNVLVCTPEDCEVDRAAGEELRPIRIREDKSKFMMLL